MLEPVSLLMDARLKALISGTTSVLALLRKVNRKATGMNSLAHITEKRNRQMRDAVNKAARLVVDHCIKHHIATVVFGWNQGQRQKATLGKTTQSFVQIPTAKLKERVKQLCEYISVLSLLKQRNPIPAKLVF
jgi:putative transposase